MLRVLVNQLVADRLDHALVRLLQRFQLLMERIETGRRNVVRIRALRPFRKLIALLVVFLDEGAAHA
jgi:hypothetical protein